MAKKSSKATSSRPTTPIRGQSALESSINEVRQVPTARTDRRTGKLVPVEGAKAPRRHSPERLAPVAVSVSETVQCLADHLYNAGEDGEMAVSECLGSDSLVGEEVLSLVRRQPGESDAAYKLRMSQVLQQYIGKTTIQDRNDERINALTSINVKAEIASLEATKKSAMTSMAVPDAPVRENFASDEAFERARSARRSAISRQTRAANKDIAALSRNYNAEVKRISTILGQAEVEGIIPRGSWSINQLPPPAPGESPAAYRTRVSGKNVFNISPEAMANLEGITELELPEMPNEPNIESFGDQTVAANAQRYRDAREEWARKKRLAARPGIEYEGRKLSQRLIRNVQDVVENFDEVNVGLKNARDVLINVKDVRAPSAGGRGGRRGQRYGESEADYRKRQLVPRRKGESEADYAARYEREAERIGATIALEIPELRTMQGGLDMAIDLVQLNPQDARDAAADPSRRRSDEARATAEQQKTFAISRLRAKARRGVASETPLGEG